MVADLERLERALRAAHEAGDTAAARKLAQAYRQAQQPEERGLVDEMGRQLGLTVRHGVQGAADVASIVANPLNMAVNAAGRAVGMDPQLPTDYSGAVSRDLDRAGLPQPKGALENIAGGAARALAGGGVFTGGAGAAAQAMRAPQTAAALMAAPTTQAAGDAAAGAAGAAVREMGGSSGAQIAAAIGAGLIPGAVGGRATRARARKDALRNAPGPEDLQEAANAAYDAADQATGPFQPSQLSDLSDAVDKVLKTSAADPVLHPQATQVAKIIRDRSNQPMGFRQLDQLRQIAGEAAGTPAKGDARRASQIIEEIDRFIEKTASSGPAKTARSIWRRKANAEKLAGQEYKAELQAASTYSGGNVENTTRQRVKDLLTNRKLRRGFNADEIEAMEDFVKGDSTQNFLRRVGKFSPENGGMISTLMFGGGAYAPGMFVPLAAGGFMAKRAAEGRQARQLQDMSHLIRTGHLPNVPKQPIAATLQPALIASLQGD